MTHTPGIVILDDAPIILMHLGQRPMQGIQALNDPALQEQMRARIEATAGIDYFILDLTESQASFSDLVMGLATMRDRIQQMGGRQYVEANLRYFICGTDDLITLMVEALEQEQYGHIEARRFDTVEQALATARAEIAARG